MLDNFRVDMPNVTSGRVYVISTLLLSRHRHSFVRWTLLTSCFSHMDTTHALFNGLTFYFMAPPVMQLLGSRHFLGLYFLGVFVQRSLGLIFPDHSAHLIVIRWVIRQPRESRVESLL